MRGLWYSGGMKRIFLYSIVGFACLAGAALWFWPDVFSVIGNEDAAKVGGAVSQEADIRTEALLEEKKPPEAEQQPESSQPVKPADSEAVTAAVSENIFIDDAPFTVQAPFGEWVDPLFQNACEEASLVMAAYWISGKPLTKEIAKREIVALSAFEKKWLGHSVDTSAEDTLKLFKDYYGIVSGEVHADIGTPDIRAALASGAIVIVPADGRKLRNPHFTQPGPTRHMLVIIGYDAITKEFIANDPGTKHGAGYRYPEKTLFEAILDYPTGDHLPIKIPRTAMIVIGKP